MKRFLLFFVLLPALLTGGCQTTPRATAYMALADVAHTVDSAMRLYGKACDAGKVSAAQQQKVDALHEHYRVGLGSAVRLARHDWSAPVPESLGRVVKELVGVLQQLKL